MSLFDANSVKCAEVRKLVEEQQYKKALEILEKININKVKSIADLNVFAHVYQKCRMYEEARDILYRIYERRPNKRVIYKLVYLAILVSDFEEAEALYEEYVEIAEGTAEQYILRYGLDKAERKDYMVRIQSLLKIKELDYTEEWAYELAKTYHKAGMEQECIDECTDIILWFGTGKIVEKATLLRAYYVDGVEVLHSYGITLNEEGQYYYDEATAQAYYKANHPKTSAGQDTQNLSAQISYITEQQRQLAIHNELTRDLEPTMDIQQAIMQETGINPAFQEDLQHMIGDSMDTAEIRYQERATRDRQAAEVEKIQKMEAERQVREAQQESLLYQDMEPQSGIQQNYIVQEQEMMWQQADSYNLNNNGQHPMTQQVYEEQMLNLSDIPEQNIDSALQEKKEQQEELGDIPTTVSVGDIFKEIDQKLEETIEETIKPKKSKKIKKKQLNAYISKNEEQLTEEESIDDVQEENKKVKRNKRFSLFSRKNKEKESREDSRLIQVPREEARQLIEQEEQARREEELRQAALKKEKETKKIDEAVKLEAEFSDDISNTKNLFEKLRGKTVKAKEENAAIEKEQNILASLTAKPLMKEEWNASIEVPEDTEQREKTEEVLQESVQEKKVTKTKTRPLTKKEWLEKTKEVSQKVEAQKEEKKKEESVIGDTISIKIKPKDTKIVIDGIDLTENFGDYAEQPRVRAQLLKELTRMREGEQPIHIALSGKDDEQTMEFVRSLGKAIKKMEILPSHRIASIDAEKLNKIQLADKQEGLKNGCVAIRNAGKITADTAQSVLNMIEKFGEEVIVILVDQNSSLDFLMAEYPALAKYFKYNLAI